MKNSSKDNLEARHPGKTGGGGGGGLGWEVMMERSQWNRKRCE